MVNIILHDNLLGHFPMTQYRSLIPNIILVPYSLTFLAHQNLSIMECSIHVKWRFLVCNGDSMNISYQILDLPETICFLYCNVTQYLYAIYSLICYYSWIHYLFYILFSFCFTSIYFLFFYSRTILGCTPIPYKQLHSIVDHLFADRWTLFMLWSLDWSGEKYNPHP